MVGQRKRQTLNQFVPDEVSLSPSSSVGMPPESKSLKKIRNRGMQLEELDFGGAVRLIVPGIQKRATRKKAAQPRKKSHDSESSSRSPSPKLPRIPLIPDYKDCKINAKVAEKMDESHFLYNRAEDLKFDVLPIPYEQLSMEKKFLTKPPPGPKRLPDLDD